MEKPPIQKQSQGFFFCTSGTVHPRAWAGFLLISLKHNFPMIIPFPTEKYPEACPATDLWSIRIEIGIASNFWIKCRPMSRGLTILLYLIINRILENSGVDPSLFNQGANISLQFICRDSHSFGEVGQRERSSPQNT